MGKKSSKKNRMGKKKIDEILQKLFIENKTKNFETKEIFSIIGAKTHPMKMCCIDVLQEFILDDFVSKDNKGFYKYSVKTQVIEGTFMRKRNGHNIVIPDDGGQPILVFERNAGQALNGDHVSVTLLARRKEHAREAEVAKILKRAHDTFVGTLQVSKNYAFLITDKRIMANDIFIPTKWLKKGKTGDKAIAKIEKWSDDTKNPIGKVIDILGVKGDNNTEMHAILAEFGLPYKYPKEVEEAANHISAEISDEEISKRRDMREALTFTIDPHDAKDFDDAISIEKLEGPLWRIGVHIADVSHYVTEGSIIDKEAQKRATSVYLVDRTIPMLPERLCNFICSLRPNEDKLAYSCIFDLDEKGQIHHWDLAHTVIRSNRRFAYEEVQDIFEMNGEASEADLTQPGNHPKRVAPNPDGSPVGEYAKELIQLNKLSKVLRELRIKNGSISFDRSEIRFDIDETGKPVRTYFKVAKDANKLVEEYMLLANKNVAEMIGKVPKGKKAKVLPYRIHDVPDPTKLEKLQDFIVKFGYKLKTDGSKTQTSKSLNKLLSDVNGKKEQELIEIVALRTMMKARYSIHNIGHYGLMFPYYTHFTSPIRRYPDTMVHRLLTRYAEGGRSANATKYEDLCDHSSAMEQLAANAERASIKYKQVEFLADRLGEEFDGKISGVTEFGIYVELIENHCEGMVPLRDLLDDYYEFDERNYCLWGRKNHKRYSLGDPIHIKIARADLERRRVDFAIV